MDALCEWLNRILPMEPACRKLHPPTPVSRLFSDPDRGWFLCGDGLPPELEPCKPFIDLAKALGKTGIKVPQIHFQNSRERISYLSDFGDLHYQEALKSEQRNQLYELAVSEILNFQKLGSEVMKILPTFDPSWQKKELDIFREWCLSDLSLQEYDSFIQPLIEEVDRIPKSFMHRDFHCRNLLVLEDGTPGIIDFRGSDAGPHYLRSGILLRDCYVDNSENWINDQVIQFRTSLIQSELLEPSIPSATVKRWFDWAGLQRHLKCVGIFHRLKIRDGKTGIYGRCAPCSGIYKTCAPKIPGTKRSSWAGQSGKIFSRNA